jgi:hypothetical protein
LRYQRLCNEAEVQIQSLVELEARAVVRGDEGTFLALQDREAPEWWQAQQLQWAQSDPSGWAQPPTRSEWAPRAPVVQELELRGDVARVEVLDSEYPRLGVRPQLRAHFYRRTPSGWVRTAPRPEFWGAPLQIDYGDLTVHTHQRDRDYVDDLLPHLDRALDEISADLRFTMPSGRIVLVFSPEYPAPEIMRAAAGRARPEIVLPSPWLSGVPADGRWEQANLAPIIYALANGIASRELQSGSRSGLRPLQRALADEYAAWFSQGQDDAQAPILGRIVERQGERSLPMVFLSLKGTRLPSLFLVRWLAIHPLADPGAFFDLLMSIERDALLAGRMDTFLLLQAPGDKTVQTEEYARLRRQMTDRLSLPIRIVRVELTGDQARVTLRAPTPLPRGRRMCELVEVDGSQAVRPPPEGALVQRPIGALSLYCRQIEVWNWMEARRAESVQH